MSSPASSNITSVLKETRVFPPPAEFAARPTSRAWPSTSSSGSAAKDDPEGFWAEQAESLHWFKPWDKVLDWNEPHAKWFVGGKLNACVQLPRPPPATGRARTRPPSSGKASRATRRVLTLSGPAPRGLQVRQRAQGAGRQAGRPRHDLHADGPRAGDRHARLRPHRRDALASSSAASAPRRSPTASTTPRPSSSSPPTAAGGAARSCRSRQNVDAALDKSPTVEKCVVVNRCNQPGRR